MQLSPESADGQIARVKVTGTIVKDRPSPFGEPLARLLGGSSGYGRKVLLNMNEAESLNSNGVSWLLVCHRRFGEAGGRFVMHSIPPLIQQVLHVLRMQLVFDLANDDQDALQTLQSGDS